MPGNRRVLLRGFLLSLISLVSLLVQSVTLTVVLCPSADFSIIRVKNRAAFIKILIGIPGTNTRDVGSSLPDGHSNGFGILVAAGAGRLPAEKPSIYQGSL